MAKRKRPGILWRYVFGTNGPTRHALRKAWRDWTDPKVKARITRTPKGTKAFGAKREDGKWTAAPRSQRTYRDGPWDDQD